MPACEVCGRETTDKLRSIYELRADGVPVSKMACWHCRAEWLARHGPQAQPKPPGAAELREWVRPTLYSL